MDLTTHQPVDLLPDGKRKRWHCVPILEYRLRDRGGSYAEGVRKGAPGAIQVADRWHLLKNLGVQVLLTRHAGFSPKASRHCPPFRQSNAEVWPTHQTACLMPALAGIREAREEERFARYEQVIALREQGMSHQAIADHLSMGHATVQRWLKEGQFPKRKVREQGSQLDPFLPYIQLRRSQGCSNMVQLPGTASKRLPGLLRRDEAYSLASVPQRAKVATHSCNQKGRPACFALLTRSDAGSFSVSSINSPRKNTSWLTTSVRFTRKLHHLVQQFVLMVRDRKGGQLDTWLEAVAQSSLQDFHSFAKSIRSDRGG